MLRFALAASRRFLAALKWGNREKSGNLQGRLRQSYPRLRLYLFSPFLDSISLMSHPFEQYAVVCDS